MTRSKLIVLVLALAALGLGLAGAARASSRQDSIFQDDGQLLFRNQPTPPAAARPAAIAKVLDKLKSLGVDEIRLTVEWRYTAPDPRNQGFIATNSDTYPIAYIFQYDAVIAEAAARHMRVLLSVTGRPPKWAVTPTNDPKQRSEYKPSAAEYSKLLRALGSRYDGSHPFSPGEDALLGYPPGKTIPRVSDWSIWNEPNQAHTLLPQSERRLGSEHPVAPLLYRGLVDGAIASLAATGHRLAGPGRDTILIGDLAAHGLYRLAARNSLEPLRFVRSLYCVNRSLHVLRGRSAAAEGCPTGNAGSAQFVARQPGLFQATGFAIHPYNQLFAPSTQPARSDPDSTPIAALGRLHNTLNRILARYRQFGQRRRNISLFSTEFGYQTNPPDIFSATSLNRQAAYLDQAEYMTWRASYVRSHAQIELVDTGTRSCYDLEHSFQSGLVFSDTSQLGPSCRPKGGPYRLGTPKPSLSAYRLPIWIPSTRVRTGRRFAIWGLVRPAANNTTKRAQVQVRGGRCRRSFCVLRTVRLSGARNYLFTRMTLPTGFVRLRWRGPDPTTGQTETLYSRTVRVSHYKRRR